MKRVARSTSVPVAELPSFPVATLDDDYDRLIQYRPWWWVDHTLHRPCAE